MRRHFTDKLCKKNQRQTGINNKSAPLPYVARAQEVQRKILINEATMNLRGDNENEEDEDDDDDDDDDDDVNDFEASTAQETTVPVTEVVPTTTSSNPDDEGTLTPFLFFVGYPFSGFG